MGHTLQPEFLPIMPIMPQHRSIPAAPSLLVQGDFQATSNNSPRSAQPLEPDIRVTDGAEKTKQALFSCHVCQSRFLTSIGLERPTQTDDTTDTTSEQIMPRASKIPRIDTVQAMFARTIVDIPAPLKSFACPLCLETIGRKGLASQFRKDHQVDKPAFFDFRPSRDMLPGRLSCAHCLARCY